MERVTADFKYLTQFHSMSPSIGRYTPFCRIIHSAMKNKILIFLVAANLGSAAAFAGPGAWAGNNQFSLSTGLDYRSGKYTARTTDLLSVPAADEYETGHWMLQVAVPYARISGTGGSVPGIGSIRAGGAASDTQSDLGGTVAAASYNIYSGRASGFGIDLTGKVKLNTADFGLHRGRNDYAAQADAYQSFDNFTALGSLGYKFLGNPAGINMNKALYGSFGGSYRLDDSLYGGVDLSLSQSPTAMGEGQRELKAFVGHRINKNFKAKGYVLKGFSNGSQDSSLGAEIYYGF